MKRADDPASASSKRNLGGRPTREAALRRTIEATPELSRSDVRRLLVHVALDSRATAEMRLRALIALLNVPDGR